MQESQLHEHIYARSAGLIPGAGWRAVVGPGDDCAVLASPSGELLLLTVDQVVEGRHYTPGTGLDLIARKAIARSVSDIAAMGGTPAWALATGVLPRGFDRADELFDAMARWARHWSCPLVGGDIASHGAPDHPLTLTVTIAGAMPAGHAPVLRSGVRPGDQLWLTGPIGGSFASGRHLTFEPRLTEGMLASKSGSGVTAMIDLSDGLGRDADRLARASGVIIEIDTAAIPLHDGVSDWRTAAAEGEDHELLLTSPTRPVIPNIRGPLGHARPPDPHESPAAFFLDPTSPNTPHPAKSLGWDH